MNLVFFISFYNPIIIQKAQLFFAHYAFPKIFDVSKYLYM